jgi:hypothetical protein
MRWPMRLSRLMTRVPSKQRAQMAPNLTTIQHGLLQGMLLETTIPEDQAMGFAEFLE